MKLLINILIKIIQIMRQFYCTKKGRAGYIVIICFKFLGDTVITIPAIRLIKKIIPTHKIMILCYQSNKEIYELEFTDLEFEIFNKSDIDLENRNFNLNFLKIKKKIDSFNPEFLFDFTPNYKTALLSFFSRVRKSYCSGNILLKGFYHRFNSKSPASAFDIFLDTVRMVENNTVDNKDLISFKANFKLSDELLFIPSAGWDAKQWGNKNYIDLIQMISKRYHIKLVSEPDYFSTELLEYISMSKIKYIKTKTLSDLLNEIKSCSIMISNDTGPIFLAALLGKPTYTIFGPTGDIFHKNIGDNHHFIKKELKCSPKANEKLCFTFGGRIGCPSNECMKLLKVNIVYKDLEKFIERLNISKKKS